MDNDNEKMQSDKMCSQKQGSVNDGHYVVQSGVLQIPKEDSGT